MSNQSRRVPQEVVAAIHREADTFGNSPRGKFLRGVARAAKSHRTSAGGAGGIYCIVWSPDRTTMTVQCSNAAQTRWLEAVCQMVKINPTTPPGRALERQLYVP